ncbi:response regulator transcription factor [Roseovarius rhodophyticola]|uniref:Response regulator transcription factor n=1 Tax=Roseovarius rhodophyticola TaxID=3080827 RepID=A0ABZ2TEB6_9RHOB
MQGLRKSKQDRVERKGAARTVVEIYCLLAPAALNDKIDYTNIYCVFIQLISGSDSKMSRKTILVVDDEPRLRKLLCTCFGDEGYETLEAYDTSSTLRMVRVNCPDLVTLDLRLGEDDGLEIAREIKKISDVPIVMVSSKDDVLDKVVGLEIGADDYISKPFHIREVVARIKAVLRRSAKSETHVSTYKNPDSDGKQIKFEGWSVVPDQFEVTGPDGKDCSMTTGEFNLLMVFLNHPKRILSREQLMEFLGGHPTRHWTARLTIK